MPPAQSPALKLASIVASIDQSRVWKYNNEPAVMKNCDRMRVKENAAAARRAPRQLSMKSVTLASRIFGRRKKKMLSSRVNNQYSGVCIDINASFW